MDFALFETMDGGDMSLSNNDINTTESLWMQIYLGLFGGNVRQSTVDGIEDDEQRFDWWANAFLTTEPDEQMNSETERVLNEVALNASGRLKIEQAVNNDLSFLQKLGTVDVEVSIPTIDRVQIDITITEPDEVTEQQFRIVWDATKSEIIISDEVATDQVSLTRSWILDDNFWNDDGEWQDDNTWND